MLVVTGAGAVLAAVAMLYVLAGFGAVQNALDASQTCARAEASWEARGSSGQYTDPCTGLVFEPVPTYHFWSFEPPALPGWSP